MTQVLGLMAVVAAAGLGQPLVSDLKNPESVAVGPDGRVYVSEIGDFDKRGDGRVLVLDKGQALPFATGLDDPKGMVWWQGWLFVADGQQVWRIDRKGKAEVFAAAEAFPSLPRFLNDLAVDEQGALYVSDSGDLKGQAGAIYRIDPIGKVRLVTDASRAAALQVPNGLVMDGLSHLLVADFGSGELLRVNVADGSVVKVAAGLGGGDGLAWDRHGRLFISDWKAGRLLVIPRPGADPVPLPVRFQAAADLCLDASTKNLLVPDMKAGTVTAVPAVVPGQEVEDTPLALTTTLAFPDLEWTGWTGKNDKGKVENFRPIVLTHAGDGSNRVFLATQHGVIHVFPNDQKATKTQVFLDLQDRVTYDDNRNEEGFLGLAFHPRFKSNGEFFVFYTTKKAKLTNIVARFRVRQDDPTRADPDSEEVLLQIAKPYWNHDGGTICFGPDGFLYISHGDGGSANDPHQNGQNLKTLLGKVLGIDVDRKDPGKNYAVPRDNPFRDRADALPEIWAYGLRNIWRMAFDRKTGRLWAGDVGQNLYEEIDLIERGGNYGWNLREGLHPFGAKGVGPRPDLVEPIWEYHHDTGKSITGGLVYRGQRFPELEGAYLYGDYVTGHIWALRYDSDRKRVVANQRILSRNNVPILSFGEDEQGEAYYMTYNPFGKGIYRFERMEPKPAR
jgi:glucose/arabinose dehydrogenase